MLYDHRGQKVRLGKREAKDVPGALLLARYVAPDLPDPPIAIDWTEQLTSPIGMMLNDKRGNCTCATPGHMIQVFTAANGRQVTIPDEQILAMYRRVGGYIDGDPSTDNGAFVVDALDDWRDVGLEDADGYVHRIVGKVRIDLRDRLNIKRAIAWFGGVYLGVGLPATAQDQANWTLSMGSDGVEIGSWGGHAYSVHGYDPDGDVGLTWGMVQRASWPWQDAYTDEAWAVVTEDWADADGAPSGLDKDRLIRDLVELA